jgi:hypothetical protein
MIKNAMWNEQRTIIMVTSDDDTVSWVPDDMANRHRVELEEWTKVKETNVIQPYVPPAEAKIE